MTMDCVFALLYLSLPMFFFFLSCNHHLKKALKKFHIEKLGF